MRLIDYASHDAGSRSILIGNFSTAVNKTFWGCAISTFLCRITVCVVSVFFDHAYPCFLISFHNGEMYCRNIEIYIWSDQLVKPTTLLHDYLDSLQGFPQ